MTKTEGIRLVLILNQMFMRKSFDSSAIILLVTPEMAHDEMGSKYEKTKCK